MKSRLFFAVAIAALAAIAPSRPAHAHFRDFPFTRDWFLPYKGEKEIESRSLFLRDSGLFAEELEFEYGITNHFAIEPGFTFVREPGGNVHYDSFDTEFRFNFGNYRTNQFLPALNIEFEKPRAEEGHLEAKFVASRFGNDGSDFSINFNLGHAVTSDEDFESEYTLGYVHPLGRSQSRLKGGLEYLHSLKHGSIHLGPVLVYRVARQVNVVTHYLFQLHRGNGDPDELENPGGQTFRFLIEYEW